MKLLHKLLLNSADGVILHSSQWGLVGQCICGVVTDRIVLEVSAIIEKQQLSLLEIMKQVHISTLPLRPLTNTHVHCKSHNMKRVGK